MGVHEVSGQSSSGRPRTPATCAAHPGYSPELFQIFIGVRLDAQSRPYIPQMTNCSGTRPRAEACIASREPPACDGGCRALPQSSRGPGIALPTIGGAIVLYPRLSQS
jgi:hypothetical protein